jgi:hypothetical protein
MAARLKRAAATALQIWFLLTATLHGGLRHPNFDAGVVMHESAVVIFFGISPSENPYFGIPLVLFRPNPFHENGEPMTTETMLMDDGVAPDIAKPRQKRTSKRTVANDPVQGAMRALEVIGKLQEQNQKAGVALDALGTVWLNAAAARRRAEAAIALKYFDGALDTLRKALEA